jgi:CRP-like cAMP-binding protein
MYFVEEGLFECSMISDKKDVQYLKNYQKGDTFGELCLLHSAKRQATVVSKMSGLIYSLTR